MAVSFSIITYDLFIGPIVEEFGTSVFAANVGLTVFSIVGALCGPIVGPLLDRSSIGGVMCNGALLMSASFAVMSVVTSLWLLGLLFGVCGGAGVAGFEASITRRPEKPSAT